MKKILLIFTLLLLVACQKTEYNVKCAGNDSADTETASNSAAGTVGNSARHMEPPSTPDISVDCSRQSGIPAEANPTLKVDVGVSGVDIACTGTDTYGEVEGICADESSFYATFACPGENTIDLCSGAAVDITYGDLYEYVELEE